MTTVELETTARVLFNTTKGPLLVGVWARELPVVTRSFLQKCIDGIYNGKAFTSISDDTVGIDTTMKDAGNFKDEFHRRIRFSAQGALGFVKQNANVPHSTCTDSFFISLKELAHYNNRYVVFGKLLENSFYTVISIRDSELGDDRTPLYPVTIISTQVLDPYFDDLVKTQLKSMVEPVKKKLKPNKPRIIQRYDEEDDLDGNDHGVLAGSDPAPKLRSVHDIPPVKSLDHPQCKSDVAGKPRANVERDPTIDSDFDARLDFESDDESWDPNTLHQHTFTPCAS